MFKGDQNFLAQTYGRRGSGLIPHLGCSSDAALRELVGRRVPLYRLDNVVSGYDLDRVDGCLAALRALRRW